MSFTNITDRSTTDLNASADINQLMENLRAIIGNGESAPEKTMVELLAYITSLQAIAPPKLLQVQHRVAYNVQSGTFTAGAWQDRPIQYEAYNNITGASLNTGTYVITLPAGTYEVDGLSMAFYCNYNKTRLWNVTDDSLILLGDAGLSHPEGGYNNTGSHIKGRFTLTDTKEIKVQHVCSTTYASAGFGYSAGAVLVSGYDNIFADFRFYKIG